MWRGAEVIVTFKPAKTCSVSPGDAVLTLDVVSVCVAVKVCEPLGSGVVPFVVTVTVVCPAATVAVPIAVVPPSANRFTVLPAATPGNEKLHLLGRIGRRVVGRGES